MELSSQMVFNPFASVPEERRNILALGLKEAIRQFGSIDGAIVIRDEGVILAAGQHRFHLFKPGQCHRGKATYCAKQEEKREIN